MLKIISLTLLIFLQFSSIALACGPSEPSLLEPIIEYIFDNKIGLFLLPYIEGTFGTLVLLVILILFIVLLAFSLIKKKLRIFKWSIGFLVFAIFLFVVRSSISVFFCGDIE